MLDLPQQVTIREVGRGMDFRTNHPKSVQKTKSPGSIHYRKQGSDISKYHRSCIRNGFRS